MGFFNSICNAGMKAGAAVTTVGAAAVETSGHAIACGALTVVGQEEEAKKQERAMKHSAKACSEGANALGKNSKPYMDLDNSHNPPAWLANWMSGVSDNRRVSELFMVGTHDTVAKMGADFAECQCWSIEKQLCCGVRFFDCRNKWDGDHLRGFHGIIDMHIELKDVAWHVENFLVNHPTEAVFLMISTKGCSKCGSHSRDFLNEVLRETRDWDTAAYGPRPGNSGMWTYWTGAWPTLGQLRGKAFMSIGNGWPPSTDVQDVWKCGNPDKKFDHVMNLAHKPHTPGTMCINFTSCTGQDGLVVQTPKSIACTVNRRFHQEWEGSWQNTKPDFSPCVFLMDFPGVDTIKMVCCRNGPGVVKKALAEEAGVEAVAAKFQQWDENQDGTISEQELLDIFSSLDPDTTKDTVNRMLQAADANKDGTINYNEFIAWAMDTEVPPEMAKGLDFGLDDVLYEEGTVEYADYNWEGYEIYKSEADAQAACEADSAALGIWQGVDGQPENWCLLRSGGRTWSRGVPDDAVLSVKVCPGRKSEGSYEKIMGWPSNTSLLGNFTAPCNVDEFRNALNPGQGYFSDAGFKGGFCRPIPRENIESIWAQQKSGEWTHHETGATYLPKPKDDAAVEDIPPLAEARDLDLFESEPEPPPVSAEIAQAYVDALRAEYVDGQGGALGDLLDTLSPEDQAVLEPFEEQVREGGPPVIIQLRQDWGLKLGCPVSKEIAEEFLTALQGEYIDGTEGAAGVFFDKQGEEIGDALFMYEEYVAEGGPEALDRLRQDWGM
mmetsp:Transcript_46301/g.83669  ORF Transcript_46301/g.83669 Transcript_46301/m.83669 type:complete len:777 (+) Transcript_46301:49-2379(+)